MRILFLASRFPYPAVKGDQLRGLKLMEQLAKRHHVDLICTAESRISPAEMDYMRQTVASVRIAKFLPAERYWQLLFSLINWRPFEVQHFQSRSMAKLVSEQIALAHYDVVFCQMVRTAPYMQQRTAIPVVLDYQDAYSLNMQKRFETEKGLVKVISWMEWKLLQRYEQMLLRQFEAFTIIADRDRQMLDTTGRITVLPNGVDATTAKSKKIARRLVFSGNLRYFPNRDAATWLARDIFPLIREKIPDASLDIVGATPPPDIVALSSIPGVSVIPDVAEMWPYLSRAEVAIVPMRSGSGMQNKVVEALAAKTAVVMTDHARAGLDKLPDEAAVTRGIEPEALAEAVVEVMLDASLRHRLEENGYRAIKDYYSWKSVGRQLEWLMETIISSSSGKVSG